MKVGIAGTGRMGAAIAQRLIGLNHELTVWNRTPGKMKELAAAGRTEPRFGAIRPLRGA